MLPRSPELIALIVTIFLLLLLPLDITSFLYFFGGPRNDSQWLLAIFVSPEECTRRAIIRSTWATRFAHPSYEHRFVIGNFIDSPWASLIDAEIANSGDIWSLPEYVNENADTANHVKDFEFFTDLVKARDRGGRRWDFVSKIDDDIWFNIHPFYETFIAPRLPGGSGSGDITEDYDPDARVVIGRPMSWGRPYAYATGRCYTVSWAVVEFLAAEYAKNPAPTDEKGQVSYLEDELVGA